MKSEEELQEFWLVFALQSSVYICDVHNNSVLLQPHARRKSSGLGFTHRPLSSSFLGLPCRQDSRYKPQEGTT